MGSYLIAPEDPYGPYVLYYSPSLNRFLDSDWVVVHDISELFDTWKLIVWKRNERDEILTTRNGFDIMIYYLTAEQEDDVFDFLGYQESFGVKTDRLYYGRGGIEAKMVGV